ncbi:YcnI family protein [Micromonospora sp. WP24]|uniref:YcnI family copper-binding membrane protein n=1 Tax=Micromonospora sp. WP24 TaxID=2604469 RepID=UPI0011DA83B9|nr:YcnI family protein [Micromonospora sp. WP24]TYC07249.1 YcnI family protein [Micromonospora sp. WP24]
MTRTRRSLAGAAALAVGVVATAVLGFAAPASAHVTVNPKEATQGGYGRIAFRVPNESDTASTVKLEVTLPENAPVGSVSTMPVPGWTVAVEKRKVDPPLEVHGSQLTEAVSKLTWTATGDAGVKPGQFQEFPVSLGPLPQVDKMVFKTLQTYSDGNISRWIEEPTPGAEEPENPAPVLTLAAASESASASAAPVANNAQATGGDGDEDEGNGLATGLGIAGLVAGLAGLVLGGLAFSRSRQEPAAKA